MNKISEQFYVNLLEDPLPLQLKYKVVEEFPEKILQHAKELDMWAFAYVEKKLHVVGYTESRIKIRPVETFIRQAPLLPRVSEILVHDSVRAFLLKSEKAASTYAILMDNLLNEFGLYHLEAVNDLLESNDEDNKTL